MVGFAHYKPFVNLAFIFHTHDAAFLLLIKFMPLGWELHNSCVVPSISLKALLLIEHLVQVLEDTRLLVASESTLLNMNTSDLPRL